MSTLSLNQEPEFNLDAFENFELNQAKAERDEALAKAEALQQQLKDQQLSHVDEISAIKKKEGVVIDPIGHVIDILQRVPAMESLIQNLQSEMIDLAEIAQSAEADKTYLAETLEKTLDAARIAASQRDKLSGELENATRQLDSDLLVIADKQAKLKALTALNPERLVKKNKELQKKNGELNDANTLLKKQLAAAKKELSAVEKQLSTTQKQKEAFEKTFSQLHEDVISGNVTDVLETRGDWQLCSDGKRFDLVYIVDTKTDVVRPVTRDGVVKARPVPAEMKELADRTILKNMDAAKHLNFRGAA